MGKINETLTLTDDFSRSFRMFIDLGNQAVQTTQMLDANLSRATGRSAGAIIGNIRQLGSQLAQQNQELIEAINNQRQYTREVDNSNRSAGRLLSTLRGIAAAAGITALTRSFLQTSDEISQINAKLEMVNDGNQSNAQLQEMIYQSAQRTRTSYQSTADIVARLGNNAREAFGNNAELIQFAENLNKQFIIAGSSQEEIASTSLQLTQALGAGALRGEELNSVFEAAPNVIRTIADYLGVGVGEIREMASEGQITAEVVKNAMLSATEDINTQFKAMPMTLSQAFTMGKNAIQRALMGSFEDWSKFLSTDEGQQAIGQLISLFTLLAQVGVGALSAVGQGALWASQNLDFIIPILGAVAAAYVITQAQAIKAGAVSARSALVAASQWSRTAVINSVAAVKSGVAWAAAAAVNIAGAIKSGAAWRAVSLANVLGAAKAAGAWTLAQIPLLLIISLVAAAIGYVISLGLTFEDVGGFVGAVLGTLYAIGYNVFASLWNLIATFAEFFANVFNDPVAAVAHLFAGALDSILSMVEAVAGAIDVLTGSNLQGAVSGFRSQLSGWVDDTFGENAVQIKRMANLDVAATSQQWGDIGSNIGSKLDNMNFSLEDIAGGLGGLGDISVPSAGELDIGDVGSVGRVKNIEGDVNLSDEDLKLYRDLAERRYMNRVELQTLAPQITVSIPESAAKNLTSQDIADKLKAILIQQQAAHTAVSHG